MIAICLALAFAWQILPVPSDQGGTIRGTVVDVDSHPISGAIIYALPEKSMNKSPIQTTADDLGHFVLEQLPAGTIYLDASKVDDGYPYSLFSFYILPGEQKPKVTLTTGQVLDDVTIKLGRRVAYLKLKVTNAKGEVLPCSLSFLRPDIPQQGKYGTSFSGDGEIPVPPAPFMFSVEAVGYLPWHSKAANDQEMISLESGQHFTIDVLLTPENH